MIDFTISISQCMFLIYHSLHYTVKLHITFLVSANKLQHLFDKNLVYFKCVFKANASLASFS